MTISAKKIAFEDERSGEDIELHYMVGASPEDDDISIDYDTMDGLSIEAALLIADGIREIHTWSLSPEGLKAIHKKRTKENKERG